MVFDGATQPGVQASKYPVRCGEIGRRYLKVTIEQEIANLVEQAVSVRAFWPGGPAGVDISPALGRPIAKPDSPQDGAAPTRRQTIRPHFHGQQNG